MRAEDLHAFTFERNDRAVVMRTGVLSALSADGFRGSVGSLVNMPILHTTGLAVGKRVLVLLDRDTAVIVGAYAQD
jgi:hypothetical protein